jgi:hypothetical protein
MTARGRTLAVLVTLVVSVALAAPAAGQTRAQWAKAANAICAQEYVQVHAARRSVYANPPKTIRGFAQFLKEIITGMDRVQRGIAALPRPSSDRAAIGSLLSSIGRMVRELRLARGAALERNGAGYATHMRRAAAFARQADALALRLGASTCANG